MTESQYRWPSGAPGRLFPLSLLLVIGGWLGVPIHTAAQVPSNLPPPSQASQTLQEAVQQNPGLGDVIRQRLQQSGLTAGQIRTRLQASGYPTNLLDPYLSGSAPGAALPAGALELSAIQALGLPPVDQSLLSVDTGLIRMRGYGTSRVFGVDVFRRTTTQFLPLLAGPVPSDYK